LGPSKYLLAAAEEERPARRRAPPSPPEGRIVHRRYRNCPVPRKGRRNIGWWERGSLPTTGEGAPKKTPGAPAAAEHRPDLPRADISDHPAPAPENSIPPSNYSTGPRPPPRSSNPLRQHESSDACRRPTAQAAGSRPSKKKAVSFKKRAARPIRGLKPRQ